LVKREVTAAITEAVLAIDDRTVVFERDQQRGERDHRRRENEQRAGDDDVERALHERAPPVLPEAVAVDEPAHLERFDRHLAVNALEIAGEIRNRDAFEPAIE